MCCVPQERSIWCMLLDNSLISCPCAHVRRRNYTSYTIVRRCFDCFLCTAMASRWRSMIAKDRKSHRWIWPRFCWASPLLTTGWPLRFPNAWALFGTLLFFHVFSVFLRCPESLGSFQMRTKISFKHIEGVVLLFWTVELQKGWQLRLLECFLVLV